MHGLPAILAILTILRRVPAQDSANRLKAAAKCREYTRPLNKEFEFLPLVAGAEPEVIAVPVCEDGGEQLIVGGQPARDGEFPHMAAIGYRKPEGGYEWSCGGTLVSERYVLTAAHCRNLRVGGPPAKVLLGANHLTTTTTNPHAQEFGVEQFVAHANYTRRNKRHDIALIRLDRDVRITKQVRPACLLSEEAAAAAGDASSAIATGWGKIDTFGPTSDVLLKVGLQVYAGDVCTKLYQKELTGAIADDIVCAGYSAGGKDTCQGDSGGPLVVSHENKACIYYVMGVTSLGKLCGGRNLPSVYTRVSSHLDWIATRIW